MCCCYSVLCACVCLGCGRENRRRERTHVQTLTQTHVCVLLLRACRTLYNITMEESSIALQNGGCVGLGGCVFVCREREGEQDTQQHTPKHSLSPSACSTLLRHGGTATGRSSGASPERDLRDYHLQGCVVCWVCRKGVCLCACNTLFPSPTLSLSPHPPTAEDIADLTVLSQAPTTPAPPQQQPYSDPAIISATVREESLLAHTLLSLPMPCPHTSTHPHTTGPAVQLRSTSPSTLCTGAWLIDCVRTPESERTRTCARAHTCCPCVCTH